ncbi:type IV secretion system protein [Pseudoalteromonas sp.]|uniref:type IV secretion system protein n=1 Tax=Pseudoalteromonas sp. TaxID=53249 RepID=UPI003F974E37
MKLKAISKAIIGVALASTLLMPPKSDASGFPVVDIASIVQAIVDYAQQLTQYAEMVQSGSLQAQELVQTIQQYEQMLNEYETILANLQDLNSYISDGDMKAAFGLMTNSSLRHFVSPEFKDMSGDLLEVWLTVDEARNGRYGGVSDTAQVLADINSLYPDRPEVVEQAELILNYQDSATNVAAVNAQYENQLEGFEQNIDSQETAISSLGAESELASLQAIANILVSQQRIQVAAMRKDAASDSASISLEELMARRKAEALEKQLIKSQFYTDNTVNYEEY